jgi:hypothetical protein
MGNLITKIEEEFKVYCTGITVGVKIASIAPSIAFVEKQYIKRELGKDQYDALVTAYEASVRTSPVPVAMDAEETALWQAVAAALCPLAAWHFAGANVTALTDTGQREATSDESTGARLWVSNLQRDTWFSTGMTEIDNLLTFLDENQADYTDWVSGTGYANLKSNILQTTQQLNTYVHINESRRFFKMLKPSVRQVEFLNIQPAISKTFYDRLISGLKASDLTAQEQVAVDMLIPAIAHMAFSECKFPIELGDDGVFQVSSSAQDNGTKGKANPDDSVLADAKRQHWITGKRYLNEAIDYLNKTATASIMEEYFESVLYEDPTGEAYGTDKSNNGSLNTVFGMP